jgi:SAM-dependent methyltransferase
VTDDFFPESIAANYDAELGEWADPATIATTVDFLAAHARGGRTLEFGIGTGRIALPLHERGVPVSGIDLSAAMVAQLRAKSGGTAIDATIGDFAHVRIDGRFRVVYLVFNTIMNLTQQDEQVACFQNAAAHLEPGGRFVVEVAVPDLRRMPPGERFLPFTVEPTRLGIDEIDIAEQRLVSHHYRIEGERSRLRSIPFRYVWPAELDLMARLAGLRRIERWADWRRNPFTSDSRSHVSVWELADGAAPAGAV